MDTTARYIALPEKVLNDVVTYLGQQRYVSVAPLIQAIQEHARVAVTP